MEEKARAAPYPLRMPDELRSQLEAAASAGNRSLHSEIVSRLAGSFEPSASGEAMKALALRLAQTEVNLHAATLESDGRLLDAYIAASSALDAVKFNELLGLDSPIDEEDLVDVQRIYRETKETLDEQSEDDFKVTIAQLQAARDRLMALKDKPKRTLESSLLSHYQIIRRNANVESLEPGPPPVKKHAPQPSPNARKRPP